VKLARLQKSLVDFGTENVTLQNEVALLQVLGQHMAMDKGISPTINKHVCLHNSHIHFLAKQTATHPSTRFHFLLLPIVRQLLPTQLGALLPILQTPMASYVPM
jgi:hypothetical protein